MEAIAIPARRRRMYKSSPIVRFTSNFWRERITRPGQSVIVGAAVSAIAIGFPDRMVGTIAFSFFVAMGLVALLVSARGSSVKVTRRAPARCMAGSIAQVHFQVENTTRHAILDVGAYEFRLPSYVRIPDPPRYLNRLAPGASHEFSYPLHTVRRGLYELPGPSVISSFPFAVIQSRRMEQDPHRLVVYPRFVPLRNIALRSGHRYQPSGVNLLSKVGESMEFMGNRPYRFGDRVRDLHTRSWARVGYPVVRQYQQEFLTRVALLVDTWVPWEWAPVLRRAGRGMKMLVRSRVVWGRDTERLEANLSLAAAVAEYFARTDCVVELFAAGPQLYHFESGRSLAHLENILDILSCIEPCPSDPLDSVAPAFHEKLGQTSSLVALLMGWDDRRRAFLDSVRGMGVEVKAVVITDNARQARQAMACGATHLPVERALEGVENL